MGLNSYTYSREQFYSDVQAYIRFKTPEVSLRALLDERNADSPFNRVNDCLQQCMRSSRDRAPLDAISYELRLLGCLVRANIRDRIAELTRLLKSLRGHVDDRATVVEDVRATMGALLSDLEGVLSRFRQLRTTFADPVLPQWIREVYQYVDEYLSLTAETDLTVLVEEVDRSPKVREALAQVRKDACALLLSERKHRQGAGYQSVLKPTGSHDHYVYRRGLLKKFVQSVLFLEISKEKDRGASEIIAGIAAGVAMLIATVLGIVSQERWGMNSLPFVLALVASYILKDRIKDWLKVYFNKKMTRFLADYDVQITDPDTGLVVGRCREAFSFLDDKKVPPEVRRRRHSDAHSTIEAESKPEIIMKYEKDVRLSGHTIAESYKRLGDINDIIRFNIASFLARTDDPVRQVRHYDQERDVVDNVKCPKVYHLNVLFVLRAEGEQNHAHLERVRVILDKRGIRRLEEA